MKKSNAFTAAVLSTALFLLPLSRTEAKSPDKKATTTEFSEAANNNTREQELDSLERVTRTQILYLTDSVNTHRNELRMAELTLQNFELSDRLDSLSAALVKIEQNLVDLLGKQKIKLYKEELLIAEENRRVTGEVNGQFSKNNAEISQLEGELNETLDGADRQEVAAVYNAVAQLLNDEEARLALLNGELEKILQGKALRDEAAKALLTAQAYGVEIVKIDEQVRALARSSSGTVKDNALKAKELNTKSDWYVDEINGAFVLVQGNTAAILGLGYRQTAKEIEHFAQKVREQIEQNQNNKKPTNGQTLDR